MSDYAPLYSKAERLRLVLRMLLIFGPLFVLGQYWFVPWIGHYARFANCYDYGGINGVEVLMYGVFVGIPLSTALMLILLLGWRSIRILRSGQDPLPGEKVLRRTRYRYGKMALITPAGLVLMVLIFVGMAFWGAPQAEKISRDPPPCSDQQRHQLNQESENKP